MALGFICILFAGAAAFFALKYFSLKRSLGEILDQLPVLVSEDTNLLLTLSSGDKKLRLLASRLNAQLRELKRLRRSYQSGDRELKEAVTNISHDLRTPLTAMSGYIELLKKEEKSQAADRYLKQIENRVEAMKRLTEELFSYSLAASSGEEMTLEPVDLRAALEESVAGIYGALVERGIEPEIYLPDERPIKNLNREALARVFGNILGNALKYSSGDLVIRMDENGCTEFSNTAENIGEVDVGKLFDRFFSVEAARNSTGLGLAISKALVEQMGGKISASLSGGTLTIRTEWRG